MFFRATIYGISRVLAHLPKPVLFVLSDLFRWFVFDLFRYRTEVVRSNLKVAFPHWSDAQINKIKSEFETLFIDHFIWVIVSLEINLEKLQNSASFENEHEFARIQALGRPIICVSSHMIAWEAFNHMIHVACTNETYSTCVYAKLSNSTLNQIMLSFRQRLGTVCVERDQVLSYISKTDINKLRLVLATDQSAPRPDKAYWISFFGQLVPFARGPEVISRRLDAILVYVDYWPTGRMHYRGRFELLHERPSALPEGEITRLCIQRIEKAVHKNPSAYLWTHRRFKHKFNKEKHSSLWIH